MSQWVSASGGKTKNTESNWVSVKTGEVSNYTSPIDVSKEFLKNPSKVFTDSQKTVDALTRIPSANYNGEFAKAYKLSTQKPTVIEKTLLTGINQKVKQGKALTESERTLLSKFGTSELELSTTANFMDFVSGNSNASRNYNNTAIKLLEKQKKGTALTPDEKDMLATAKLVSEMRRELSQNTFRLTDDPTNNASSMTLGAATQIYSKAAYGTENQRTSDIEKNMARTKLYVDTGFENFFGGYATIINRLSGVSAEEIAATPESANTVASGALREYYGNNQQKFNIIVQDVVTNMAQNAIPMLLSAATMMAGVTSGSVLGMSSAMASRVVSVASFAPSVFGNAYKEATKYGITSEGKLLAYAGTVTAAECGLEYLLGSSVNPAGGVMSGEIIEQISKKINSIALKAVTKIVGNGVGEFTEETIQGLLSPILQKYILGADVKIVFDDPLSSLSSAAYDGFIGFLSSMFMGGVSNVQSAISESNLQKNGAYYKYILKQTDIDINDIATYFKEISTSKDFTAAAEKVLKGDTSDLAVGEMLSRAVAFNKESLNRVYTAIGQRVLEAENGVELVLNAYETTVKSGAIYPESVNALYRKVKENISTGNIDTAVIGEFAFCMEAYSPKAHIMGRLSTAMNKDTQSPKLQHDGSNSIKEQLQSSQERLSQMKEVADIKTPANFFKMDKTEKQNWVIEKLQSTNYEVNRKGFGIIKFAKKHLKSAFNYFMKGSAEEATFEALPFVLENGVEISNRDEHKGRGYGTVTIAAPISINGRRGNMAVVVKRTDGNYYKVHRVLTPDGSVFDFLDKIRETEPTPAGESPQNGSLAAPISTVSNNSISGNNKNVNTNSQLPSGENGGIISGNDNVITGDDGNGGQQVYNDSQRIGRESGNTQSSIGGIQETNGRVSGIAQESHGRNGRLPNLQNQGNNRRLTSKQEESLKSTAIKNEDGTAKEVYHFTDNMEFETFGKGDIGFHFGSEVQAQTHKENLRKKGKLKGEGRFIKVLLDIKNPVHISTDIMVWKPAQTALRLWADGVISEEEYIKIRDMHTENGGNYSSPAAIELRRILSEKGYDGIVYQNNDFFEGEGESYIAFYPEQVIIIDDGKGNQTDTDVRVEADGESFFDEPSADFPAADFIQDAGARLAGVERHSDGQRTIIEIGRKLGYKVIFDPDLKTKSGAFANGKIDRDNKIIYINPKSKKAKQFIFKHELTHHLETNFAAYADFANAVMDSKAFKDYVISRGYNSTSEFNAALVAEYGIAGVKNFGEQEANNEMVADFVGDCLFTESNALTAKLLESVKTEHRNAFVQAVKEFFVKIKRIFSKDDKTSAEIRKLEKRFVETFNSVEQKQNTADNSGGMKYSISSSIDLSSDNELSQRIGDKRGSTKYKEIQNYILEVLADQPITLSDGKNAIVDRSDAQHISRNAGNKKITQISEIKKIIENAELVAEEESTKERKFDYFYYYGASVKFGEDTYPIYLNVGRAKNDGTYHIYDITQKLRDTAHRINDVGRPVGDAMETVSLDNSISNSAENVKEDNEKYSISADETNTELLARYERGEISGQELIDALTRKKAVKETPKTIADLTEEDANTTPPLKRRKGENKGDKESKFYGSLLDSDIFDQRFKDEVETDTWIQSYKSVSNEETLKEAARELDEGGHSYVLKWNNIPPERASLIDTAVGFILMDRYQRIGDYDSAIAVAEKVRQFGTASGRQVQIFSIIGRLDPNAMSAYAQQTLSRAYEQMVKDKSQKWIDQNADKFQLTDEEIEFIRRRTLQAALLPQDSRDKAIKLAEICQMIQDKIPAAKGQKIRTLQRISMLLNVKTQVRNIIGNAGMVPVFITSDFFGVFVDKAVSKKTNIRTTGNFHLKGSGTAIKKGLYESWDDFKRDIHTKEELDRFDIEGKAGKSFNEKHNGRFAKQLNALAKTINGIDRFTSFCLEAGDRPFFEMWLNNSLNNLMRINNVTTPTAEMLEIAAEEALQRTWQDSNTMTRAVGTIKKTMNLARIPDTDYGLGDFTIKFVKTPANIAKAIGEFSPVGFAFATANATKLKHAIETGQFTPQMQKEFVRSLSNAITGTLIYVAVFSLAGLGLVKLSGAGDDDKDVSNFERYIAGIPPYSMEIFGVNVTYDWMQPMGAILATIADFMESRKQNPDNKISDDLLQAIKAGAAVFTEQSFLKSLYELFSSDGIVEGLTSAALAEPATFIPQFSSQVANFTDEKRRTTYDPQSEIKTAINKILIKIPGLRQKLPEQVNVLGEDSENTQYLDPYAAFISPYNTYPKSAGKVADEIYSLYKQTGDKTVMPRVAPKYFSVKGNQITFNTEERADFQRRIGLLSSELLSEFFDSKEYSKLPDEQKVKVINNIYNFATRKAKTELDYSYEIISAMEGNRNDGTPFISKTEFKNMSDKMKKAIAEDCFLTKTEIRFGDSTKKVVEYYIKQVKK